MFSTSMFEFSDRLNPFKLLDGWLHPYKHKKMLHFNDKPLTIHCTARAKKALDEREHRLIVEMQLYFSCVVKKRIIFHDHYKHDSQMVLENLFVSFRAVEPTSCDPIEFAKNYPEKRELNSTGAHKMRPKALWIDNRKGEWVGEYSL